MGEAHQHLLRVRYGECDAQGVVFNANYFVYFDVAQTEMWRDGGLPYQEVLGLGVDMVVAEAQARFLAPAKFDDELLIRTTVSSLGNTSVVSDVTVKIGTRDVAAGRMRHVFVDPATGRPTPVPDEARRVLEQFALGGDGET